MLKFVVIGIFQGATYGLLAVGLVLVYKGTRAFNFAQGEFGTVAAFATWGLFQNAGLPYAVAALAGLACAVILGLIVERVVIRPLMHAPRITVLVATLGVALFIISGTILAGRAVPRTMQPALTGDPVSILGAGISLQLILLMVVLVCLAPLLAWFFSKTSTGLAVLATSQDSIGSRIVGISVPGMSKLIWAGAALLGGIAGILQAPVKGIFYPGFMTLETLIPAFAAAVLGGMDSLTGAFIAGELVGIVQSLGTYFLKTKAGVPGAEDLTVFVLLLVVLLARPRGLLGKEVA